ncbi:Phage tail tube protein [Methylomagnum ishizawai]|uniref:Phage tail tube protein n=1 Tax=Methylomagnum ishizawai TaxID=1760988 RepID=A0A1Y6D1A8_9GAMM|nr:phage tail tube protein [Methylomagnum ishizawai]SMF94352.1 Phage tail tube protein [Methylomagnum ishizawai]
MAQVAGRSLIFLNGTLWESKNGSTLTFGGINREPVVSDNKVVGPRETIAAPSVEATFIQTADLDLVALNSFQGSITFQQDIGSTWIMSDGFCDGQCKVSNGEVTAKFYGSRVEQSA